MFASYDSSDAGFASSSPSPDINKNSNNNNNSDIFDKVEGHDLNLALSGFPNASRNNTITSSSSRNDQDNSTGCDNIGWRRLLQVLLLGLLLFLADVCLHLAVAGKYLAVRDCHRGLERQFDNFNLAKILDENRYEVIIAVVEV